MSNIVRDFYHLMYEINPLYLLLLMIYRMSEDSENLGQT